MKYVIGIDLGTSAVKILLMNEHGAIVDEATKSYPLSHPQASYSEQNPAHWVEGTTAAIQEIMARFTDTPEQIVGVSYSGQMHGLVLLDEKGEVLRPAILWNDTRTTKQCQEINALVGEQRLLQVTKNRALEGFTLPKMLWVQQQEPAIWEKAKTFLLPKDYVRYVMTDALHMDFSDAAGTLLLDVEKGQWSEEIAHACQVPLAICPPLVEASEQVGTITPKFAKATGLSTQTKVYAGGADNACGAIGAGIVADGKSMLSIGTSGVVVAFEATAEKDFGGKVHYFNHAAPEAYYSMGVTLSAGHALQWFKETFAPQQSFEELLEQMEPTSKGLLFTPYLVGERTPHADATIRGSFIGMDANHTIGHFTRAVVEGIVFSLRESIEIFRAQGKKITDIISIGGGAKNRQWLQIQADILQADISKLRYEQGPGMGACLLAAVGAGVFGSFQEAVASCVEVEETFAPQPQQVELYNALYPLYQQIYQQTKGLNEQLQAFR